MRTFCCGFSCSIEECGREESKSSAACLLEVAGQPRASLPLTHLWVTHFNWESLEYPSLHPTFPTTNKAAINQAKEPPILCNDNSFTNRSFEGSVSLDDNSPFGRRAVAYHRSVYFAGLYLVLLQQRSSATNRKSRSIDQLSQIQSSRSRSFKRLRNPSSQLPTTIFAVTNNRILS